MAYKKYTKKQKETWAENSKKKISDLNAQFDRSLDIFFDKTIDACKSDEINSYFAAMSKFWSYSYRNQILIAMQMPEATKVAGYQSWKKKFNRHVKKGEKGICILRPQLNKRDAKPLEKKNADKDGKVSWISFKATYVFDVSQTEGEDLPEVNHLATGENDNGGWNHLSEVAAKHNVKISVEEIKDGASGYSMKGKVVIDSGLDQVGKTAVLAHELAHELLHQKGNKLSRELKEVEAETVAFVVCQAMGIDHFGAANYVATWSKADAESAKKMLTESLTRIRNCAAVLLGGNGPDKEAD